MRHVTLATLGLLLAALVPIVLVAVNAFGHLIEPWFAGLAGV
jgi:hypothetical protein